MPKPDRENFNTRGIGVRRVAGEGGELLAAKDLANTCRHSFTFGQFFSFPFHLGQTASRLLLPGCLDFRMGRLQLFGQPADEFSYFFRRPMSGFFDHLFQRYRHVR
jgi:hypothetical protein